MQITTHACERYLERELKLITWTTDDIEKARKYLLNFVCSMKHQNLSKRKNEILHVLIGGLIMVFSRAKEVLITLYPMSEKQVGYLIYKKNRR